MNHNNGRVSITIDNKPFQIHKGLTILQAAEQNNIYIPTLCAHKELTPYGGCRMCLVEVEGARGFLTACTTPVEEGMIIRTHTAQIQKERKEILELILSEHTSSCLICDERTECRNSMSTIRKVGVTTGCRYCPNDDKCELEKVVSWLEITDINHPVYYRGLRVEKEDPFYDRDYNLCILCGRCVRVCQEVRNANVLSFNHRGRSTVIGPAFNRTHIDAGCEFCGACVSMCPTGALSEKSNKWDGVHDQEEITTCALCGVGCQMRVLIKNDRVMGTLPADDNLVNNGQLCVKGRFCVNELVNHYQRLKSPMKIEEGSPLAISWDEALDIAAGKLSDCPADEFAMIVSPNCTNEDLYVAQKFTRAVIGSNNIDCSARLFYGTGFNAYIDLMKKSVPLARIDDSDVILALGLDMQYGRSTVGVKIRRAIQKGAKIITIHPREHSLALSAEVWVQPEPGEESDILEHLNTLLNGKKKTGIQNPQLKTIAEMLKKAANPVILLGAEVVNNKSSHEILERIDKLAVATNAGIVPLPAQNNLYGSLLMGVYPELLAGGVSSSSERHVKKLFGKQAAKWNTNWNAAQLINGRKLKVIYLIGETAHLKGALVDFVIYQNIYPLAEATIADLTLPATAFTETSGSFINGEGRLQRVNKAAHPPKNALPDWQILCRIAQKMGVTGFDYSDVSDIQKEIAECVKGFTISERPILPLPLDMQLNISKEVASAAKGKSTLEHIQAMDEHVYRGIPLAGKVDGFRKLMVKE